MTTCGMCGGDEYGAHLPGCPNWTVAQVPDQDWGAPPEKKWADVSDQVKVVNVTHVALPYDLTEATLVPEPGPYRSATESFEWLATEGGHSYGRMLDGERERIIISAALLLSRGVPIAAALDTAIIWERG